MSEPVQLGEGRGSPPEALGRLKRTLLTRYCDLHVQSLSSTCRRKGALTFAAGAGTMLPTLGKRSQDGASAGPPPAKRSTPEPSTSSLENDHQLLLQILARYSPENRVRLLSSALQRLGMGPAAAALQQAPLPSLSPTAIFEAGEDAASYSYFE